MAFSLPVYNLWRHIGAGADRPKESRKAKTAAKDDGISDRGAVCDRLFHYAAVRQL